MLSIMIDKTNLLFFYHIFITTTTIPTEAPNEPLIDASTKPPTDTPTEPPTERNLFVLFNH